MLTILMFVICVGWIAAATYCFVNGRYWSFVACGMLAGFAFFATLLGVLMGAQQ